MKRVEKISLSSKEKAKLESGAHRQALVELGMYSIPTHKVHKNKRKYNRKQNQNTKWQENA
jgi:hypothetical protein